MQCTNGVLKKGGFTLIREEIFEGFSEFCCRIRWKLKDKYTHNTCQIYVKPHSKNTQITLESQIFDEKALR